MFEAEEQTEKTGHASRFPILVVPVIFYNAIALFSYTSIHTVVFEITMISGADLVLNWGDIFVMLSIIMFFGGIYRTIFAQRVFLAEKTLSVLLLIFCVFELLVLKVCATASFLFITLLCMLDIASSYVVSLRMGKQATTTSALDN